MTDDTDVGPAPPETVAPLGEGREPRWDRPSSRTSSGARSPPRTGRR